MRDPVAWRLRSFWLLSFAGGIQILVALGLLVALLFMGQRRLIDFVVILPIVAMLFATAAGALVLASHTWADLGRRLAAPRLPGLAEGMMKRLNSLPFGNDAA